MNVKVENILFKKRESDSVIYKSYVTYLISLTK